MSLDNSQPAGRRAVPVRFLAAAGLAALAVALNAVWLARNQPPTFAFVSAREDIEAGRPFEEAALKAVELPDPDGSLRASAVPWDERHGLLGQPSRRGLRPGAVVLWEDALLPASTLPLGKDEVILAVHVGDVEHRPNHRLIAPGDQVSFDVGVPPPAAPATGTAAAALPPARRERVGPFRVVSLAPRTTPTAGGAEADDRPSLIAVAVPRQDDGDTPAARLRAALGKEPGDPHIVAVTVDPLAARRAAPPSPDALSGRAGR